MYIPHKFRTERLVLGIVEKWLESYTVPGGLEGWASRKLTYYTEYIALTIRANYNPSASSGITIYVLFSPDGNNFDTDTDYVFNHPFSAGATKQKTYLVRVLSPYIKIKIKNNDPYYGATVDVWATYL